MSSIHADPQGWPYFRDDDGLIADFPLYTRQLNDKLANSDAAVADAINAANQAQAAAQSILALTTVDTTHPTLTGIDSKFNVTVFAARRQMGMAHIRIDIKALVATGQGNLSPTITLCTLSEPEFRPAIIVPFIMYTYGGMGRLHQDGTLNLYNLERSMTANSTGYIGLIYPTKQ